MEVVVPMPIPETLHGDATVTDATRSDQGGGSAILGPTGELPETSFSTAEYLKPQEPRVHAQGGREGGAQPRVLLPVVSTSTSTRRHGVPVRMLVRVQHVRRLQDAVFREIWTGPKYRELRQQIYDMQLRDVCANCSVAKHGPARRQGLLQPPGEGAPRPGRRGAEGLLNRA
jgi:hypothetical protein